jgi:hypothetical protein
VRPFAGELPNQIRRSPNDSPRIVSPPIGFLHEEVRVAAGENAFVLSSFGQFLLHLERFVPLRNDPPYFLWIYRPSTLGMEHVAVSAALGKLVATNPKVVRIIVLFRSAFVACGFRGKAVTIPKSSRSAFRN